MSEVEQAVPEVVPAEQAPAPEEPAPENPEEVAEDEEELTVDLDALPKMRVSELKDILKALDLPTSGIKTTLIERIQEHFAQEDEQQAAEGEVNGTDPAAPPKVTEEEELLKEDGKEGADFIELEKPAAEKSEDASAATEQLSDEEKRKARAEKFGTQSDGDKKEARAAKFGILTESNAEAKKEERAAKFGIITDKSLQDKKLSRAERFGSLTGANKLAVSTADKQVDDEKLKKRAARFNLDTVAPAAKTAKTAKTITYDIHSVLDAKVKEGKTTVDLSPAAMSLAEKKKMRALKFGA